MTLFFVLESKISMRTSLRFWIPWNQVPWSGVYPSTCPGPVTGNPGQTFNFLSGQGYFRERITKNKALTRYPGGAPDQKLFGLVRPFAGDSWNWYTIFSQWYTNSKET